MIHLFPSDVQEPALMKLLRTIAFFCVLGALLFSGRLFAFGPTITGGPQDGQMGVPLEAFVNREFDLTLSGATVNTGTVLLKTNATNTMTGAMTGNNHCTRTPFFTTTTPKQQVICEHNPLSPNTWYTFQVTTGVKTATGMALATNQSYRFKTNSFSAGDFVAPPFVAGSFPRSGNQKVPTNAKLQVTLVPNGSTGTTMRTSGTGSVLSPTNVQLFRAENGQPISGAANLLACPTPGSNPGRPTDCNMAFSGTTLIISPGKKAPENSTASAGGTALVLSTEYVLVIKGSMTGQGGARNTNNAALMSDYRVSFKTATGALTTAPNVKGSFPQDAATSVDRATYSVSIVFTQAIDPLTVTPGNVLLYKDGGDTAFGGDDVLVTGTTVEYFQDSDEIRLSPNVILASSTKYFVEVLSTIKDMAGNSLDGNSAVGGNQNKVISFVAGTTTNAQATDNTQPKITFANVNNFEAHVTFSEPMLFDVASNLKKMSSTNPFVVNNTANWQFQSPNGQPILLNGKSLEYVPSTLTLKIIGLALPPNQSFFLKAATSTGATNRIRDLAGNTIATGGTPPGNTASGSIKSVFDGGGPGGHGGEFNFSKYGSSPLRVFPQTPIAGEMSSYFASFPTTVAIPSGGKIVITFPSGFSFLKDGSSIDADRVPSMPQNSDINGPATGLPTVATVTSDNSARTLTIVTGGATTVIGDQLNFVLQGIVNSTVPKDSSTGGYAPDIKTFNAGGTLLESLTSQPFPLNTAGAQRIEGFVFNDNGAGGGTAADTTKNGSEPGIAGMKVCIQGPSGFNCLSTSSSGAYAFRRLSDGTYKIMLPPLGSGSLVLGGPSIRDISLTSGGNKTGLNFGLRSTDRQITVNVSGIPTGADLDVFAFNATNAQAGGTIMRKLLWSAGPQNGSASATIPVLDNSTWTVGVGPAMADASFGPVPPPTFSFLVPQPQQTKVAGSNPTVTFALQTANRSIVGKVVDGAGAGIANTFIMARPSAVTSTAGGGSAAQTQSDGSFTIKVGNGTFLLEAASPGLPPAGTTEVTVQDNVSGADGNATADVYNKGSLVASPGIVMKLSKDGYTISGKVLDEQGNAIAYAFVKAQEIDSSGNPIGGDNGSPTDSSGNFTIYVKNNTKYKLYGFAPGVGQLPSKTVSISGANMTGQNLQASSADLGTVTGQVTKGGVAVAGAFVNIFGANGGNGTVSDTSGNYSMKVKGGAGYRIEGFVPGGGRTSALSSVTVTLNQTLSSQNLTIGATATLTVTLTGSKVITNAFIDARDSSGLGNGTSTNTTAGVYVLSLPVGTYTVRASNPDFGLIATQENVTLTAGQSKTIALTTPTVYRVAGLITSTSTVCKNATGISFTDKTNGRVATSQASSTGSFSIYLPNGTYSVFTGKPGCQGTPGTVVVSGAAIVSGIDQAVSATDSTIVGRVTYSSTGVTVPTFVRAQTSDGKFAFANVDTTKSGGGTNYTLNVGPGTWTLKARCENGYESADTSATVTAGASVTSNLDCGTAVTNFTRKDPTTNTLTPTVGGVVYDSNIGSDFKVNIPAGAFGTSSNDASLTTKLTTNIPDATATAKVLGGKGFVITAAGADGSQITSLSSDTATITVPYSDTDVTAASGDATKLTLAAYNDSTGEFENLSSIVDTTAKTVTATTSHFSTFGILSPVTVSSGGSSSGGGSSGGSSGGGGGGGGGAPARRIALTTAPVSGASAPKDLVASVKRAPLSVLEPKQMKTVRGFLAVTVGKKLVIFKDVPSVSWFSAHVGTVLNAGIASGYKDERGNPKGEYGPARNVTYAEIAKMAFEAAGTPPAIGIEATNTTAKRHWSTSYIGLAERLGISVYIELPDIEAFASRGAVIQTLVEVLGLQEMEEKMARASAVATQNTGTGSVKSGTGTVTGSGATVTTGTGTTAGTTKTGTGSNMMTKGEAKASLPSVTFSDLPSTSRYAASISLMARLGVITGDTDKNGKPTGKVRPNAPINRAEVAKIFSKLIELKYLK